MKTNQLLQTIRHWSQLNKEQLCFAGKEPLTYGQLEQRSDALADYFAAHAKRQQPIVIFGGMQNEMVVSFIACQKSGNPYIPIDMDTPSERIQLIIETARPACIVALTPLPFDGANAIDSAEVARIFARQKKCDSAPVSGDEIVYIIFTSGTTGKPKGVPISYNNLVSFTQWMRKDFNLKDQLRFLCQAPFSFDLSVMDLYPALLTGGTLVPVEKQVADDFQQLFQVIPKLELNVWVSTPSLMELCLVDSHFDSLHLPSLKYFFFCGEELSHSVAQKLVERFPQAAIYNTYGPTEITVAVTSVAVTAELLAKYERLPLGKAKADTRVTIQAEDGEIIIAGPSVAASYYQDQEKSRAAFFHKNGQRAYHTGDLGYFKDGLLFYQGRIDSQIKWHGYRIELGDVDAHLDDLPQVRQACVLPRFRNNKVQQLIAYVVPENSAAEPRTLSQELKAALGKKVMDYMIPQKFVFCPQLPLTTNGKVDRKKLAAEVNGK